MSSLVKKFNSIESNYLDHSVKGIQVWPLVREEVFQEINENKNKICKPNVSDKDQTIGSKINTFLRITKNTLSFIFSKKKSVDYLILNHPRKKIINGKYFDIYTDPIIDGLKGSYLCLERLFQMRHLTPSYRKNVLYADIFDYWPRLISLVVPYRLNKEQRKTWEGLENIVETKFGVKVNIVKKLELEIRRALIAVPFLVRYLKTIKPKMIIEVVGYNRFCKHTNIAASTLNIPTIELQHGIISKGHIGYNFPNGCSDIPSFPMYLGIWSDFYKDRMNIPIKDSKIIKVGFKYFEDELKRMGDFSANTTNVLFISQGSIGKYLIPIVKDYVRLTDNKVIYKLHPSEVQDSKERYKEFYKLEAPNLLIDSSLESDLYKRIMEAEVVVGVYSTALLEAASLGKKTIVLEIQGWEYFEELINGDELPLYLCKASANELNEAILNSKRKTKKDNLNVMGRYNSSFPDQVLRAEGYFD